MAAVTSLDNPLLNRQDERSPSPSYQSTGFDGVAQGDYRDEDAAGYELKYERPTHSLDRKRQNTGTVLESAGAGGSNNNLASQPVYNNQNTILMAARNRRGELMLMHETRIFYFCRDDPNGSEVKFTDAAEHINELFLNLLTTRKFRLLTSFYLLWRVLDYLMLACLVSALFLDGSDTPFADVIWKHKCIFSVLAVEVFYDVLQNIVKIWMLNRVSLYIGLALYGLYCFAFSWPNPIWSRMITALLAIRFGAFVFEVLIDICIDLEVEYDLCEQMINPMDVCFKSRVVENIEMKYVSGNSDLEMPRGWRCKGSVFAWTWHNTFHCKVAKQYKKAFLSPPCFRLLFSPMFCITYGIVGIPLMIIVGISVFLLSSLRKICCCCRHRGGHQNVNIASIGDECCNRYSY